MKCYLCLADEDKNVPLLRCGHYVCPPCYCRIKQDKMYACLICDKKLIRGCKKNKIET